ncbi:ferritin [Sulfolobus acidocaldarius SUSAZ]|nr:ferritin [Sulfolobus acidocaldarius SUSAZ]
MFSSDPSVQARKEKLDKEEEVRALRGALMAELDAINYYLQQGKLFENEHLKRVHEDIAKEEIAHFGEFLRLLYEVSKEDFDYIVKGWKEASELIGSGHEIPIPRGQVNDDKDSEHKEDKTDSYQKEPSVEEIIHEALKQRKIRYAGTLRSYPDESISLFGFEETEREVTQKMDSQLYKIEYLSVEFKIRSDLPVNRTLNIIHRAGVKYSLMEDELLLSKHPLSIIERGRKEKASDWDIPGSIANDIIRGVQILETNGYSDPVTIISPELYTRLFRVYDKSGTYEIKLVKHATDIIVSPLIRGLAVVSKKGFYIMENTLVKVEFLGREGINSDYIIWGKIAPYLIDTNAAVVFLRQ